MWPFKARRTEVCLAINSVRLAVLIVHVTARDTQAGDPHGGASDAGDLLNVMDYLTRRDCIAPALP